MRVLIAEDDRTTRHGLHAALTRWGYDVLLACDGNEAWQVLQREDAPPLVILDWLMPGMDGIDVCHKARRNSRLQPLYIIMLTVKESKSDIVEGLEAGANDYVIKPFDLQELRARVGVGERMVELQSQLADRVSELEESLSQVKQLQGLLPICCYCKRIRDDRDYWQQVEIYVTEHSQAQFSHTYCPDCHEKVVKPQIKRYGQQASSARSPNHGMDMAPALVNLGGDEGEKNDP